MQRFPSILFRPFLLFIILTISGTLVMAEARPVWWERAEAVASRAGYALINIDQLRALYDSGKDFLLVDVRPSYEYRDGHLPGAVQLEFDLGERSSLKPEKSQQFVKLLGPNKNLEIIIYCRNYS